MSSYKGHLLFAFFISLIFFQGPIFIALTVIGASLPDFDHDVKKSNVYKMIIIGLIMFIILYITNQPYLFGLIFLTLPIIFYFSKHRGFTHSILGIFSLSLILSLVIIMGIFLIYPFLNYLNISNNIYEYYLLSSIIMIVGLGILILNKNIIPIFLVLFLLGVLFLQNESYSIFNIYQISHFFIKPLFNSIIIIKNYFIYEVILYFFIPIFLGLFSHVILDSFSPAGVKVLNPFSSKKVHKKFSFISMFFIFSLACFNLIFII
ncbi:MAG: metal-dependent hydrolase [Methanobrevibacter sp.]|nr:metal-dependent hydrolase [Methanobrevibacter sp.]MEA4956401.1 metal-dependent hydrolase [Methanobrevibacter sp.]